MADFSRQMYGLYELDEGLATKRMNSECFGLDSRPLQVRTGRRYLVGVAPILARAALSTLTSSRDSNAGFS